MDLIELRYWVRAASFSGSSCLKSKSSLDVRSAIACGLVSVLFLKSSKTPLRALTVMSKPEFGQEKSLCWLGLLGAG